MFLPRILASLLGVLCLVGLTLGGYTEKVDTNRDYLGCYNDDKTLDDDFHLVQDRALPIEVEQFSSKQDCVDQCGKKGMLYAGLQNGDLCFCGNEYDKYGRADDADCNLKCRKPEGQLETIDSKDSNMMFNSCGGRWRNAVYAVVGVEHDERVAALKWWQKLK